MKREEGEEMQNRRQFQVHLFWISGNQTLVVFVRGMLLLLFVCVWQAMLNAVEVSIISQYTVM